MELPVIDFIRTRIAEADPDFETRPGTVYHEMFIKPQQLMLQPLNNTMDQILVSQSIRRILAQPDPDSYSEEDVDDIVANLYVTRDPGATASCSVRVYYSSPREKQFPALSAEFTSASLSFFNTADILITEAQMSLQTEGTLYYMDVPVVSQEAGSEYKVAAGDITGFLNDTEAIRVTNLSAAVGGLPRETNTELLSRAQNSIGVRDLETVKGINAILREKFPFIRQISAIGFADVEMQRDVLYNAHVGGKTDVYIKTPSITETFQDFVGLDYDTTREISRQIRVPMAKSVNDALLPSYTGTPQIVVGSLTVKEDIIETAASILSVAVPPGSGINLVGKEYIKVQIDGLTVKLIKISGATPAQTQRFEIINSINASIGLKVAAVAPGNKIRLSSPTVGSGSSITFFATAPQNQGATDLFGVLTFPASYVGVAAEVYTELTDYEVDYLNGNIYQKPYPTRGLPTILSGQDMVVSSNGVLQLSSGTYSLVDVVGTFNNTTPPVSKTRIGDELTVHSIGGLTTGTVLGNLPQTFLVSDVISDSEIKLQNFEPTAADSNVSYTLKSNQVVVIDYKYNPISIDIGGQVLLVDGLLRGVRPGRGAMTIKDTPFIDIVSIVEIDPESGEAIAEPLLPPRGFGFGGFGEGAYGVGAGGEYEFKVLAPRDRFSVFDDLVILFGESALTKSYRVTYRWVPELVAVHDLSRNDSERVTGADVLPKHYVPAFVDIEIGIRRDSTNLTTPTNDGLAALVQDFVNGKSGIDGIQASDISKLLEDQGVDSVRTPFTMTATVLNTDGTTTILESQDILIYPDVTLEKDTDQYVTKKIVHFLPGNITVVEV